MKKYVFLASVIGLIVAGVVYAQQSGSISAERSVEFNIAELSPNGEQAGYAMPASGGSPPTSQPGCAIAVDPQKVDFDGKVSVSWLHGILPGVTIGGGVTTGTVPQPSPTKINDNGATGAGDAGAATQTDLGPTGLLSPFVSHAGGGSAPVVTTIPSGLEGVLQGLSPWRVTKACIAYCNLDDNVCDPNVPSQWIKSIAAVEPDSFFAEKTGIAYAGSGGGACGDAKAVSRTVTFNAKKSGNFVVGIKAEYSASYRDGNHSNSISRSNTCFETFQVGGEDKPELMTSLNSNTAQFGLGEDVVLSATIKNMGNGKTDRLLAEDGMFNYLLEIDVNDDGFTDGSNGDISISSGDTLGPLADQYNISSPWKVDIAPVWDAADVVTGTHGYTICADANNTVTEVQEGNNCTSGTFTVEEYDISAHAGTPYAVYGEPLVITGSAKNAGDIRISIPFNNQIEVRNPSNSDIFLAQANGVNVLERGGDQNVSNIGFDHEAKFGPVKNLEYRVWVDTDDDVPESNDNLRPDINGNNDSLGWAPLGLINPEIHPEPIDRNGTNAGYWGPFVFNTDMTLVFDIYNDTPRGLSLKKPFVSTLVIDRDGNCGDNVSLNDSCINSEDRIEFTTNSIVYDDAARAFVKWRTSTLGTYRARVYADSNNTLPELNESDNVTTWQSFEVVESLPGQEVSIEADPVIARKNEPVTLTWDVGAHLPSACRVTKNNNVTELDPLAARTGTLTVRPNITAVYSVECDADGILSEAKNSVTVQVLPVLYES